MALGQDVITAPMLSLTDLSARWFDLDQVSGLSATSQRVAGLLQTHPQLPLLRRLPVFAVGDRTAEAFRELGFEMVYSADGDVEDLCALIGAHVSSGKILYLAARDRRGKLEERLAEFGLSCVLEEIYSMEEAKAFPTETLTALQAGEIFIVLIYSARSAQVFRKLMAAAGSAGVMKKLLFVAISEQAAEPLGAGLNVTIAARPREDDVLKAALSLC